MDYFNGIDPMNYVVKTAAADSFGKAANKASAEDQFRTIFYTELLKQVFEGQAGYLGQNEGEGYFGNIPAVNDIFINNLVGQLVSTGKMDKLTANALLSGRKVNY